MNDAKYLTTEQIEAAYAAMSRADQLRIDMLARQIETAMKAARAGEKPIMFGREQALELLAKLGMYLTTENKSV